MAPWPKQVKYMAPWLKQVNYMAPWPKQVNYMAPWPKQDGQRCLNEIDLSLQNYIRN